MSARIGPTLIDTRHGRNARQGSSPLHASRAAVQGVIHGNEDLVDRDLTITIGVTDTAGGEANGGQCNTFRCDRLPSQSPMHGRGVDDAVAGGVAVGGSVPVAVTLGVRDGGRVVVVVNDAVGVRVGVMVGVEVRVRVGVTDAVAVGLGGGPGGGTMRPMRLPFSSVNQTFPSGPPVIRVGPLPAVSGNSSMAPSRPMRPMRPATSVNHTTSSGPVVMPSGPVAGVGITNSVMTPAGVILPMRL